MISICLRRAVLLLLVGALAVSLQACGTTMNPVKRKPLQIDPMEVSVAPGGQPILLRFEEKLAGKPLSETVWDNVSGAFWDVEESNQIGFTQDYSRFIPVVAVGAVGGAIGGAVAGAVAGAAGPELVETRIVIPFGRIFVGTFQSGVSKAFPNSITCLDKQCESAALATGIYKCMVRIEIAQFGVWERPTNHINFQAAIISKVYSTDDPAKSLCTLETRQESREQSVGSVMTTSSGFIAAMNRLSNEFAGALSRDVMSKLRKELEKH